METVFDKPLDTEVANRLKFSAPGDITASNIDDYTTTGLYQAYFNANINNGVAGAWGTLQVTHVNSAVVEQMMSTPNGIAIRHKENSTWYSWTRLRSIIVGDFSTNASGATDMPVANYIPMFAFLSGYVLVPYYPPNASNWHIRDTIANAPLASKTVTICYIRR